MNAQAERIEALAAEAEMYQQDAAAFNCTQRAEHHKEVAEALHQYVGVLFRVQLPEEDLKQIRYASQRTHTRLCFWAAALAKQGDNSAEILQSDADQMAKAVTLVAALLGEPVKN